MTCYGLVRVATSTYFAWGSLTLLKIHGSMGAMFITLRQINHASSRCDTDCFTCETPSENADILLASKFLSDMSAEGGTTSDSNKSESTLVDCQRYTSAQPSIGVYTYKAS